jgi:RimJ/RimL family protein N-acetyltransferase
VTLRPAAAPDCRRIWTLRNDEDVRRASFDSAVIPWDTHQRWFLESLERGDRKVYMVEVEGLSQGVARLDIARDEAAVSIHLAPEWRGRGIGPVALGRLSELAFHDLGLRRLVASVKSDNLASRAAFAKAGFIEARGGPVVTLRREREP